MSDISKEDLEKEVTDFLKGADLSVTSSKKVRQHLSEKLGQDLTDRKKEIDALVMAYVENHASSEEVSEEETPRGKDSDQGDDDYAPSAKKTQKAAPSKKRKAADNSDDSDDGDWGKKKKKAPAAAGGGGAKKQSAFTKSFRLSPELADVVGAEVMPRHQVVKKLWAVIKERNLQDPKQKQYAICDEQLLKVFGIKRFRTFGMMKYLKDHFVEAA